jgi:ABC-type uncharacterized transport system substrate-binding protein
MRRRTFITLLGGATAWPLTARAQRPANKISVGFLSVNTPAAMKARTEAFQQGLRELGYVDGQNIFIEYRFAEENPDRLRTLASELVALKVSVIVTEGTTATRFAKEATSAIPIVMAQDPDPVATGFVASLARPGGILRACQTFGRTWAESDLRYSGTAFPGLHVWPSSGHRQHPATRRL